MYGFNYNVVIYGGAVEKPRKFVSKSRNSKKILMTSDADFCEVYLHNGKLVSKSKRLEDGTVSKVSPQEMVASFDINAMD